MTEERKPLVLVVDDMPRNLQILSTILDNEGYDITFANNGRQAIEVANSASPDLILLDVMMPEMDGFEACKILKSTKKTKDIPIIFITGRSQSEDIIEGFKAGAVDYVTKPFNTIEMVSRIHNHLELKLSKDRIIESNLKLEEYRKELEQTINAKDKFFSIIAHDLRGPFSGFIGLSAMLMEDYEELGKEDVIDISSSLNNSAKQLYELLENLLEWSRSQMGKIEYHAINLDLYELVVKINSLLEAKAKEKSIQLINEVKANTYVFADSNMINTILRNIVSNALKFTEEGGQITINSVLKDNMQYVSVTDTGVGMSEDAMEKIFQIDSKYTTPGTNAEKGTGLGLILCRELIERLGGTISVSSTLGKGTTFTFTLPVPES